MTVVGRSRSSSPRRSLLRSDAEKARLLAERDDLKSPLRSSSMTEAQRDGELTQLNGKLYTVAKAQFDKSCPAVANAPPS